MQVGGNTGSVSGRVYKTRRSGTRSETQRDVAAATGHLVSERRTRDLAWIASVSPLAEKARARFFAKVSFEPNTGCWLWMGAENAGYGVFTINRKRLGAHRVSVAISGREVPPDLDLLHSCHTPWCVNPGHLRPGTPLENVADMRRAGRARRTSRRNSIKLAADSDTATRTELAARFGVTLNTVYRSLRGSR